MGVDVYIETEFGERIEEFLDPKGIIARLLPIGDNRFSLLRYIDLYGNTIFNRLQMEQLLFELEQLKNDDRTPEEIAVIEKLQEMARRCQNEPHLYLKFYGD